MSFWISSQSVRTQVNIHRSPSFPFPYICPWVVLCSFNFGCGGFCLFLIKIQILWGNEITWTQNVNRWCKSLYCRPLICFIVNTLNSYKRIYDFHIPIYIIAAQETRLTPLRGKRSITILAICVNYVDARRDRLLWGCYRISRGVYIIYIYMYI